MRCLNQIVRRRQGVLRLCRPLFDSRKSKKTADRFVEEERAVKAIKHVNLELERLESRIAPGGGLGAGLGISISVDAEASGSGSGSKSHGSGSKGSGSKGHSPAPKGSGSKGF